MRGFVLVLSVIVAAVAADAFAGPKEDAKAGQLFDKAEVEYQAGRFQRAIDFLLEAQQIAPDPVLDYNLARAYEGLGQLEQALASYRAYLVADPKTRDRGAVEARIKTLETLLEERAASAAQPPVTPPPATAVATSEPRSPSAVPWVIAGVGALGLGAGGVLGGLALSRSGDAEDAGTSGVDTQRLHDEASSFALGANIAFGVGGAVLAAGVVWGVVDVVSAGDGTASKVARLELRGDRVQLTVAF